MKIRSVKAWLEQLPLTRPYSIAYKTIYETEIVFFEITLENGIAGIGAANPFAAVVGETPAVTLVNLQKDFMQGFIGRDIRYFNRLIDEALIQFPRLPGTIAAIDIALHDAFCQLIGIPIADFYGRKTDALPTSITIGIKETAAMLEEAKAHFAAGFKIIKIKTGVDVEQDIERVQKLAENFGKKMLIRVDANQGYDMSQLKHFIEHTKKLSLEVIEQPLPVGKEEELAVLDKTYRKLMAADESLIDAASALQLTHPPVPYGIFNIKLMKSGGIRGAKEIALIAANAGISLFWGCNDESKASIAAALHAAYSCSNTKYIDLDGSFDLSQDFVEGGFILKNGLMYCTDKPGLGVKKI
jgi:L-alanine-DL-glutamate epimerase-like enolase superfamily enzyme